MIVYAPNVHGGGGMVLLNDLLAALPCGSNLIVDERAIILETVKKNINIYRIKPTLRKRIGAEKLLKSLVRPGDQVLCFGNLPPLFSLPCFVSLFIQNRHLVSAKLMLGMPFKIALRLQIERRWLTTFHRHADLLLVQTPAMQKLATAKFKRDVDVAGFMVMKKHEEVPVGEQRKEYDFIYVASGEPHKNHCCLLDAWVDLARKGFFPSLCLTVNKQVFPQVVKDIEFLTQKYSLKIKNHSDVHGKEILGLYYKSKALIYPSKLESFGLPLIEAQQVGLRILASELDYVRDILDPEESFDPESPASISRAVCRFMAYDQNKTPVLTAKEFLARVVGDKSVSE